MKLLKVKVLPQVAEGRVQWIKLPCQVVSVLSRKVPGSTENIPQDLQFHNAFHSLSGAGKIRKTSPRMQWTWHIAGFFENRRSRWALCVMPTCIRWWAKCLLCCLCNTCSVGSQSSKIWGSSGPSTPNLLLASDWMQQSRFRNLGSGFSNEGCRNKMTKCPLDPYRATKSRRVYYIHADGIVITFF